MTNTNTKSVRFLELDALRGIAASLVVIFHFTKVRPEAAWLKLGVTGVDLFFIISGFVILLTLEKTIHWKDFVVSRFSRLYPTYWTCVTLTALLIASHLTYFHFSSFSRLGYTYIFDLTMFQHLFRVADLDPPYWTMLVEMLFYLFMLIVFILKKLKSIELIGIILLIPIFIYSTVFFKIHFPLLHYYVGFYDPLINHFPLFLTGILFYKIKTEGHSLRRYAPILVCFICQLFLFDDGGRSKYFISFFPYAFMLFCYYLILILYVNDRLNGIKNKALLFIGKISFSLYLFHQVVGEKLIIPGLIKYLHFNFWLAAFFALVFVIAAAYLVTTFIERPAMRYIRNKHKKYSTLIFNS